MDSPLDDILIGKITEHWAKAQNISCVYFEKTDSTNLKAKSEAFTEKALEEQLIIYLTEEQSSGKGRGTNLWHNSKKGSQLLSTWSFMLTEMPQVTLTPLLGLALYRAASATWPFLNFSLKAPNDLYLNDKKIAGLLVETLSQGDEYRLLIGLGLNVIHAPSEVTHATSIVQSLPEDVPLLAQDWISFLERLVFEFSFSIQMGFEPLNSTCIQSLLKTLNLFPSLDEPYTSIDSSGNLTTKSKTISWQEI